MSGVERIGDERQNVRFKNGPVIFGFIFFRRRNPVENKKKVGARNVRGIFIDINRGLKVLIV